MILCDTGRALALGSIPIAFALGELTLVQLYLVSLIEGTLFIFFNLAEAACLPHVVSKEQLPAATAQDQTLYAMSGLLGLVNAIGFIIVPVYTVMQYSYRLALIPDELQGRVNSFFRLSNIGSQPIGLMLTGVLLQAIGPVPTVLVLFVPQLVLCIAATLNPKLRSARPIAEM